MNQIRAVLILALFAVLSAISSVSGADLEPGHVPPLLTSQESIGGRGTRVVDFGTQPLAVPIGVVGAVIGRDRLLRVALKGHGWELRSHSFRKGIDSNVYFQRGDLDAAVSGDWPTITLAASADVQVIGLAKQGFSSVITRGLRRMADLKGKRVGSPPGSTAQYGLLVGLANLGMKESDITIVPMEVTEMSEALAQGKVDAFAAWEPTSANALRVHPEFVVAQRFMNNSYIYLSADLARQNPEIAELVAAAYVRALRWMRDDRKNLLRAVGWTMQDAELLLGKPTSFSPEEMAKITTDELLKLAASPQVPRHDLTENGSIRRAFNFLQWQGKIAASVSWQKIEQSFDQTLIEKILADPAKYRLLSFDYE